MVQSEADTPDTTATADGQPIDLRMPGYRTELEIGRGGFAVVYRATRTALNQHVALKLLRGADHDPQVLARFERERTALGRLAHHPHIVTVYDGGTTPDGTPFLAMEYVRNGSLADELKRSGPLTAERVLDIGVKLAGALEAAHLAGVLHRDVKPENVLLSGYGQPLLADFGIAHVFGGTRTRSGVITASIAHAPPEVLDGKPSGPTADVYSLASTLFCLLAGAPAFTRPTDESMLAAISRAMHAPVPDLRGSGVPDPMCGALEWGMAKQPEQRPRSAAAFGEALRSVQHTLGLPVTTLPLDTGTANPAMAQPVNSAPLVTQQPTAVGYPELPRRRRPYLAATLAAAVTLALVGTGVAVAANIGAPNPVPGLPTSQVAPAAAAAPTAPTSGATTATTTTSPTTASAAATPGPAGGGPGIPADPANLTPLLLAFTDISVDGGELRPPDQDISTVVPCPRPADQAGKLGEAKRTLSPGSKGRYLLYTHVAAFSDGGAQALLASIRTTAASCSERLAIDPPTTLAPPPGADEAVRVTSQSTDAIWVRRGNVVAEVYVSFRSGQYVDRTTAPDLAARAIAKVASTSS